MDTPKEEPKVHDIYPDIADDDDGQPVKDEGVVMPAALNYARRRPSHVPRPVSQSYPAFKQKQACALKIGLKDFEEQTTKATGISYFQMMKEKLTIHFHSQSKLSQQELSDLQKATHFDKKELQQWYKGRPTCSTRCLHDIRLMSRQAS